MKVDRSNPKFKPATRSSENDSDRKVTQSTGSKFLNFMDKATDEKYEDKIKKLAADILAQGEKLGKRIDVRELKQYKALIAEFLNQLVNNSYSFVKNSKLDRRGRYKVFVTVKRVNEELDELTNEVLSNQVDNIKILKKIEDIRGLILDLEL